MKKGKRNPVRLLNHAGNQTFSFLYDQLEIDLYILDE